MQAPIEPCVASLAIVLRPELTVSPYVTGMPAGYIAPFDAMYAVDSIGSLDDMSIKAQEMNWRLHFFSAAVIFSIQ
jgi:hypothetical protein